MSLMKNLRRREVEIFGARRVVRNDYKKEENKKEIKQEKTAKRGKRKTEGK